jgi:hypothetical protein
MLAAIRTCRYTHIRVCAYTYVHVHAGVCVPTELQPFQAVSDNELLLANQHFHPAEAEGWERAKRMGTPSSDDAVVDSYFDDHDGNTCGCL